MSDGFSPADAAIALQASLDEGRGEAHVEAMVDAIAREHGPAVADALLKRIQVARKHRRLSIAIYDHALHVIGGGQRYVATLASALQDRFEVTYLVNREVDLARVGSWYGIDLSRCKVRVVPLPFFEGRPWIDSSMVTSEMPNPFDAVARASADYDVFVNANMLEKVRPLSPLSIFICHFPDVLPRAYFAAHEYTLLVAVSRYGASWIEKRWGLSPSLLLYPPVDLRAPARTKERIILSVARFEPGGSKKQVEMATAFCVLREAFPDELAGWRLVLAGGSLSANPYLRDVEAAVARGAGQIEMRVNVPLDELREWYSSASIFWHACGLGEVDPHLVEHFGMTTVEAMQNGCVAVVFDGGGQREIVAHGQSGFRFRTLEELCSLTVRLIRDPAICASFREQAKEDARRFGRRAFEERTAALFDLLDREYATFAPGRERSRI